MLKVLLLNNRVPFPLKDGGAKATYSLLNGLANDQMEVDVFFLNTKKHYQSPAEIQNEFSFINQTTIVDIDTSIKMLDAIGSLIKGKSYNIERFDDDKAQYKLSKLLRSKEYDIIHFENLFMVPYLRTVKKYSTAKCVLRMHNVEHQIWERLSAETTSWFKRIYLSKLAAQMKSYEELSIPQFDAILPISEEDAAWARKHTNKTILTLPMGLKFESIPKSEWGKNFFHIGSMEWMPNQQACAYLVNEIWPKVIEKNKDCHLHLAGKGMGNQFDSWATENIHIHGEVDDAKVFMEKHNTMLIPLKSASGMRIKALEAFSLAKPVISTRVGMSGLLKDENKHFIVADTKDEMVQSILQLADDNNLYETLALQGYTFVKQNYDERKISLQLKSCYEQLLEKK